MDVRIHKILYKITCNFWAGAALLHLPKNYRLFYAWYIVFGHSEGDTSIPLVIACAFSVDGRF